MITKPTVEKPPGQVERVKEKKAPEKAGEVFAILFMLCLAVVMIIGTYKVVGWMLS